MDLSTTNNTNYDTSKPYFQNEKYSYYILNESHKKEALHILTDSFLTLEPMHHYLKISYKDLENFNLANLNLCIKGKLGTAIICNKTNKVMFIFLFFDFYTFTHNMPTSYVELINHSDFFYIDEVFEHLNSYDLYKEKFGIYKEGIASILYVGAVDKNFSNERISKDGFDIQCQYHPYGKNYNVTVMECMNFISMLVCLQVKARVHKVVKYSEFKSKDGKYPFKGLKEYSEKDFKIKIKNNDYLYSLLWERNNLTTDKEFKDTLKKIKTMDVMKVKF